MPVLEAPPKTIATPVRATTSARDSNRLVVLGTGLLIAIFLACATLATITTLQHEPWRDEADAWLLVRDESITDVFARMCYVGTPALWYLCIFPLAKMGAPYLSISLLNLSFGLLAVFLLMFRSPLPYSIKALVPLSCLFLYEYPVVARSYSLSVLLIFTLATMYAHRFKRPWLYCAVLGLLANTNIYALCFSACIFAPFGYKLLLDRQKFMPCSLAILGILFSALQIIPQPDVQIAQAEFLWYSPIIALKQAFFPNAELLDHSYAIQSSFLQKAVLAAAAAGVLASVGFLVRKSKLSLWYLGSICVALSLVFLAYLGGLRHWGFYVVLALFALWTMKEETNSPPVSGGNPLARVAGSTPMTYWYVPLFISICYSAFIGIDFCSKDIARPFSAGAMTAKFLRTLPVAPIVSLSPFTTESILPYLPGKRFFYPNLNEYGTHMRWTREENQSRSYDWLIARTNETLGSSCPIYLVCGHALAPAELKDFRLLYDSTALKPICHQEGYFVYARRTAVIGQASSSPVARVN
jgi:hypothetical protein